MSTVSPQHFFKLSRHVIALRNLPRTQPYSMDFDGNANKTILSSGRPPFIYGTAWKKERTTELVKQALSSGFRAIDTAAQPKHYQEPLVGDAIRAALHEGTITRDQIYVSFRLRTSDVINSRQHLTLSSYKPSSPHPEAKI